MSKIKSKSWDQYTIQRFGEYLVTAELCRRGFIATPFAGNLPDIDIIAMSEDGSFIPVQVKTIKQGSSWQFRDIQDFVEIQFDGVSQSLKSPKDPLYPNLICVLVQRSNVYGEDLFFVLNWGELRDLIIKKYGKERRRLRNPKSTHCAIYPRDLNEYKDKWDIFEQIRMGLQRE